MGKMLGRWLWSPGRAWIVWEYILLNKNTQPISIHLSNPMRVLYLWTTITLEFFPVSLVSCSHEFAALLMGILCMAIELGGLVEAKLITEAVCGYSMMFLCSTRV